VLGADAELAELVGLTDPAVILVVLIAVLYDRLTPGAVFVGARELSRLTFMFVVVLRLVVVVRPVEVVRLAGVLMLVLGLVAELLAGTLIVGAVALEVPGELVIVVNRGVEDEELLEIGSGLFSHCML
jgi:hypothetical protein